MSNASIIKAGVIGDPVAHSRSPLIFEHWLTQHAIKGSYERLHVRADNFDGFIRALMKQGFAGANVTVPHKQAACVLADQLDGLAKRLGAVNTLIFDKGMIIGRNTDGYGFCENLKQQAPDWKRDSPALIIGAGGAARAIVAALADLGVPEIRMANRTASKVRRFQPLLKGTDCILTQVAWGQRNEACEGAGLLVNTTSLGMYGCAPLELDLLLLPPRAIVADIVYAPLITPLLQAARARGLGVVDGLGMLLHQAVLGFEAWFGRRPAVSDDLRAVLIADLKKVQE